MNSALTLRQTALALCLCAGLLMCLGVVMLYSASYEDSAWPRFRSHLHWIYLAVVVGLVLARLDYAWLERPGVRAVMGGGCLLLLLAVLVPGIGVEVNGARRWLPGLGQPSELAKPVLVVLLAAGCARLKAGDRAHPWPGFARPALLGAVPALLVFRQPDWGTCVLLVAITLTVLLVSGARWGHVAMTVIAFALALGILVQFDEERLDRILVFLDPEAHRHGSGWQVWQSLLAIGSGGWRGRFLEGAPHKYGFVPEQQTDFIFARVGEELGLWGGTMVVLLFAGILLCGLRITRQARDRFGRLLAWGCTMAIVLQAFINLAVTTGLAPNKGLPLPFVSYGGSNMLAMSVCLALLVNVAWRGRERDG